MGAPLIVTLDLDEEGQAFFDRQRRCYFPPQRNVLAAHVTLFHALPASQIEVVRQDLARVARRVPAFPVRVPGLRFLGRGVAYTLVAPPADGLRHQLAQAWEPWLTRQDRQRFAGHVTVANKLEPPTARRLFDQLAVEHVPFEATAEAVSLYRYLDGPWELVERYPLAGSAGPANGEPESA